MARWRWFCWWYPTGCWACGAARWQATRWPSAPWARWTVGILGGMGLGILLLSIVDGTVDSTPLSVVSLIICQIIMGVICFLATQMLIRKSLRVFRESWKEVAALCVALIAITIAV